MSSRPPTGSSTWVRRAAPAAARSSPTGTPEQIAAHPDSYTGEFLRHLVEPRGRARAAAEEGRQLRLNPRSAQPVEADRARRPRPPERSAGRPRPTARPRRSRHRRVGSPRGSRSTTSPSAADVGHRPACPRCRVGIAGRLQIAVSALSPVRPVRWTYGGTPTVLPRAPDFPSAAGHKSSPMQRLPPIARTRDHS